MATETKQYDSQAEAQAEAKRISLQPGVKSVIVRKSGKIDVRYSGKRKPQFDRPTHIGITPVERTEGEKIPESEQKTSVYRKYESGLTEKVGILTPEGATQFKAVAKQQAEEQQLIATGHKKISSERAKDLGLISKSEYDKSKAKDIYYFVKSEQIETAMQLKEKYGKKWKGTIKNMPKTVPVDLYAKESQLEQKRFLEKHQELSVEDAYKKGFISKQEYEQYKLYDMEKSKKFWYRKEDVKRQRELAKASDTIPAKLGHVFSYQKMGGLLVPLELGIAGLRGKKGVEQLRTEWKQQRMERMRGFAEQPGTMAKREVAGIVATSGALLLPALKTPLLVSGALGVGAGAFGISKTYKPAMEGDISAQAGLVLSVGALTGGALVMSKGISQAINVPRAKPQISIGKTKYISTKKGAIGETSATVKIKGVKGTYKLKIISKAKEGAFLKGAKGGKTVVPKDVGSLERHTIFVETPKGEHYVMYGHGKAQQISSFVKDLFKKPELAIQHRKEFYVSDVEILKPKTQTVSSSYMRQKFRDFVYGESHGGIKDFFTVSKERIKGVEGIDYIRAIPGKPKPVPFSIQDTISTVKTKVLLTAQDIGTYLGLGKGKSVKVSTGGFIGSHIKTAPAPPILKGFRSPAPHPKTSFAQTFTVPKVQVKPLVTTPAVLKGVASSIARSTGGTTKIPTTIPSSSSFSSGMVSMVSPIIKGESAYFSRVGTIKPKFLLDQKIIRRLPFQTEPQMRATAFNIMGKRSKKQPASISNLLTSSLVSKPATKQMQRMKLQTLQLGLQRQALEQQSFQRVVGFPTGRVFPPGVPGRVISFPALVGGGGAGAVLMGRGGRLPTWYKYWERKWPVATMPKEIAKAFGFYKPKKAKKTKRR